MLGWQMTQFARRRKQPIAVIILLSM